MDLTSRISVVISATTAGAVKELDDLHRSAAKSGDAFDSIGARAGLAGSTIKAGLVAGATALVGTGLVSFLNDSAAKFGDAAKAAGDLASASGGTVEGVSRMQAALADAGVSSETSADLLTKFTTNAGKSKDTLDDLGVVLKKNKDGTIDYANGMVQAVDAILKIGDASERNQKFVELFGKKGAQAFQDLAASGVDLSAAMEAVSKYRVFNTDDVARAVTYDDAMDKLGASVQGLQFALGRELIPILAGTADAMAGVVEAATPVLALLASVPTDVYLVAGAAVLLSQALQSQLVAGAFGAVLSGGAQLVTGMAILRTEMGLTAAAATTASRTITAAFATNPVTGALLVLTAAYAAFSVASKNLQSQVDDGVARMRELEDQGRSTADALKLTAEEMEDQSNILEDLFAAYRGKDWGDLATNVALGPVGTIRSLVDALRDGGSDLDTYEERLRKAREEQGEFAAAGMEAAESQNTLNDAVASFLANDPSVTWQNVADAVLDATAASLEQQQAANLAEVAMGQYAVSLQGVADWQGKVADSAANTQSALGSLQDTLGQVGKVLDDPATWENEIVLNTAKAEADLWKYVGLLADSGLTSEQIIPLLMELQGKEETGAEADALIQAVIAAVQGKSNEMPVDIRTKLDPASAGSTKAGIDGLVVPQQAPLTVVTTWADGGYGANKARKDYMAQAVNATLTVLPVFADGGYSANKDRKDYLAQTVTGTVFINTVFTDGGYSANKARKDYLSQDTTATITVNQRRGVQIPGGADGDPGTPWRLPVPTVSSSVNPINLVRVLLDGQQLRAVVRDEIRAGSPIRQGVA